MTEAMNRIQPHNERPATIWSAGGKDYDAISRGIADRSVGPWIHRSTRGRSSRSSSRDEDSST